MEKRKRIISIGLLIIMMALIAAPSFSGRRDGMKDRKNLF
jgi:hypothetical protein